MSQRDSHVDVNPTSPARWLEVTRNLKRKVKRSLSRQQGSQSNETPTSGSSASSQTQNDVNRGNRSIPTNREVTLQTSQINQLSSGSNADQFLQSNQTSRLTHPPQSTAPQNGEPLLVGDKDHVNFSEPVPSTSSLSARGVTSGAKLSVLASQLSRNIDDPKSAKSTDVVNNSGATNGNERQHEDLLLETSERPQQELNVETNASQALSEQYSGVSRPPLVKTVLQPDSDEIPSINVRSPTFPQSLEIGGPVVSSPIEAIKNEHFDNQSRSSRDSSPRRRSGHWTPVAHTRSSLKNAAGILVQASSALSLSRDLIHQNGDDGKVRESEKEQEFKWPYTVLCALDITLDGREVPMKDIDITWTETKSYDKLMSEVEKSARKLNLVNGYDLKLCEDCHLQSGSFRLVGTEHRTRAISLDHKLKFVENLAHEITGFIHFYRHEKFRVRIKWTFASHGILVAADDDDYATTVRNVMESRKQKNFEGKEYIPRSQLFHMLSPATSKRIIDQDRSLKKLTRKQVEDFALTVQWSAQKLQALCVYRGLSMRFLKDLLELKENHNPKDIGGPFNNEKNPPFGDDNPPTKDTLYPFKEDNHLAAFAALQNCQPTFFAYKFGDVNDDLSEVKIPPHTIVPIYFHDKNDYLGHGAYSEVFRASIHPDHHSFDADRNKCFALKRYIPHRDQTDAQRAAKFNQEIAVLKVLQKIRKADAEHINLHKSAWTQENAAKENAFYILLPLADLDLLNFMNKFPTIPTKSGTSSDDHSVIMEIDDEIYKRPLLDRGFVEWFLRQLWGLAKALESLHEIPDDKSQNTSGNLAAPMQSRHGSTTFHHDIKANNILVFFDGKYKYGTLKFADFGSAGVNENVSLGGLYRPSRPTEMPSAAKDGTPTYEGPDRWLTGFSSRRSDVWSLGCVFMELLIWCLDPYRKSREQFFSKRIDAAKEYNENDFSDAFWVKVEDNKSKKKAVRNKAVDEMLDKLSKDCCEGKPAFKQLLKKTKQMLTVDIDPSVAEEHRRIAVYKLASDLEAIKNNTQKQLETAPKMYCEDDPQYYVLGDVVLPISPTTTPADAAEVNERLQLVHQHSLPLPRPHRSSSATRREVTEAISQMQPDILPTIEPLPENILDSIDPILSRRPTDFRIVGASIQGDHYARVPLRTQTHPPGAERNHGV